MQNVIATYRGNYVNGGVPFDVSMMRLADRFLRGSHGISHAMLLQGITKIDRCAEAPVETAKVNDGSTIRAIDDLLNASVKPIFISSDAVFDGTQHLATEDDAVCPILTYGKHKSPIDVDDVVDSFPGSFMKLS